MKIKQLLIGATCWAILVPSLAHADKAAREAKERAGNRTIMFDYAKCVVKQRHARAAEAILKNAGNDEINKKYSDLIRGDCLVSAANGEAEMTFGGDLYRYALADALVNADLAKTSDSDFSNRAPLAHVEPYLQVELDAALAKIKSARKRAEVQEMFDNQSTVSWLSRYGECVVRHNPVSTKAWLLTAPNAPEESVHIAALQSAFGDCLVGRQTQKFNRMTMRGLVAINYYRLAMAAPVSSAGLAK